MDIPNEAQRLIESHISTLDEHKGQLERALAHLDGSSGNEGEGRGQKQRGQGRRAGQGQRRVESGQGRKGQGAGNEGRQAPRGARRAEVIADLEANPGSKATEIANRVGIKPNHAQTILANLVSQGVATKEGALFTATTGNAKKPRGRRDVDHLQG